MDTQYATVVTLSPSSKQVEVVDFETAFGEHSEFRGRGRARRQKRRLERIKNRAERKRARQAMRAEQQEARQTRKDRRKKRRVARKSMGDEAESETPEPVEEQETPTAETEDETADDQNADSTQDPAADEQDEQEESFDGEVSDATGVPMKTSAINPVVKDLTHRIVWNKEAIKRHKAEKAQLQAKYNQIGKDPRARRQLGQYKSAIEKLTMDIQKHEDRLMKLENELKKFGEHPHIQHGYKAAKTTLQKHIEGKANIEDKAKVKSTISTKGDTVVAGSLNPEFSHDRIEIPSQNSMKKVEISSNFGGETIKGMSTSTKWILGLAAVGVAVMLAKKYKVI